MRHIVKTAIVMPGQTALTVQNGTSCLCCALLPQLAQINPQLLALLVEMAAFQAKLLGGVRNVVVVALDRIKNSLSFKLFHSLGKRPRPGRQWDAAGRAARSRQSSAYRGRGNSIAFGKQQQAFNHVAQLADVARPPMPLQGGEGIIAKQHFLPSVLLD